MVTVPPYSHRATGSTMAGTNVLQSYPTHPCPYMRWEVNKCGTMINTVSNAA